MKIGFIKPNYDGEKRIALLPEDIRYFSSELELYIESDFGEFMDIPDSEYESAGANILSREKIFHECDIIFSLKLILESDYEYIKREQIIIGWIHPEGSGKKFMQKIAYPKDLLIVDIDNMRPKMYWKEGVKDIDYLSSNFIKENSYIAGKASVLHALLEYGSVNLENKKIAILSSGNVSQGSFNIVSKLGGSPEIFYRGRMSQLYENINEYDVIINGAEISEGDAALLESKHLKKLKDNCLLIDAAADAGRSIEGSKFTWHDMPLKKIDNYYFYSISNTPSLFYRDSSQAISSSIVKNIFSLDSWRKLRDEINEIRNT